MGQGSGDRLAALGCRVGLIGGTGLYDPGMVQDAETVMLTTPYGVVELFCGRVGSTPVAFLPRHGRGHGVPPHRVNYRAHIWALRQLGARAVLATSACGALVPEIAPGTVALIDQFIDFTRGRPSTFFDGGEAGVRHVDMTAPYCPTLRQLLQTAAARQALALRPTATYVCTEGPRFETPAEIRAFAQLGGHLVGMTGVPEVVLAREAGLCYASVAIATNYAAGLANAPLSHDEVVAAMEQALGTVRRLLLGVAEVIGPDWACTACPPAPGPIG